MNKSELIDAIAAKAGLKKADAKNALEAFMATTNETLKAGGKISLVGFGTFSVSERGERKGRNPKTGATMTIPAKKVVKFKAGADMAC
ncbi:MAG: HU family DNA-binding protein [Bacteroidales bacterium]|nr:HU family DNA-binding protein [Bacteroidales bacterium]